jgi:hypothetical protein
MPGTETLLKRRIEVVARSHYLDLSNDPASALPSPTPKGAETFTQCILDRVFALGVIPRAMEAARACDVQRVYGKSVLQEKLADALRDFFSSIATAHPRNHDKASAFAEVIVAEIPPAIEQQAFDTAAWRQYMTEHELQEEAAREREAEIERNRRRPPRKSLYPC